MANVELGANDVGSIVKLNVNGAPLDFIVVHQGLPSSLYDDSCKGSWLLLKDILETGQWYYGKDGYSNSYKTSNIHSYLNSTWINQLDVNIQSQIKQAKIPYVNGVGGSAVASGFNGLPCKIFLLSGYEAGFTTENNNAFPLDGAKLDYFEDGSGASANEKRIASLNGSATRWWLRSPYTATSSTTWNVTDSGNNSGSYGYSNNSYGVRPALILPPPLLVSDDGSVTTNTAPTTPPSITIPDTIQGGSTIDILWEASADAENNLEGYIVERSIDGGTSWVQIYQGNATTTRNTVAAGTQSVMYRVKGYDSEGLYIAYRTSSQITVINNTAPASITVPNTIYGGQYTTITWGAATDPDGDAVTVTEGIDSQVQRTFTASPDETYTFMVTGETFMKILNGDHALNISASDGKATTHKLLFKKEITSALITLVEAVRTGGRPNRRLRSFRQRQQPRRR